VTFKGLKWGGKFDFNREIPDNWHCIGLWKACDVTTKQPGLRNLFFFPVTNHYWLVTDFCIAITSVWHKTMWQMASNNCASPAHTTMMNTLYTISSLHLIPLQNTTISALHHHTTDSYLHVHATLHTLPMPIFSARQHAERAICYRKSVCPSVCLSHGWISRKRLKLGSCNFHRTVAPSL